MIGRRRFRNGAGLALVALLASACITVVEEAPLVGDQLELPPFAVAQTIPLGKPSQSEGERQLIQLYDGILRRMQEAADDRQVDVLFDLLNSYQKPGLPDWLANRLKGYRALAHGLRFLEHAVSRAELRLVPATVEGAADGAGAAIETAATATPEGMSTRMPHLPPIGDPLQLEFMLPPMVTPIRLGGHDDSDPVTFAIAITYEDLYVHGGSKNPQAQGFESLPREFVLQAGEPLRLPIRFAIPTDGAVRRTVHVRVDILPGYVRVENARTGDGSSGEVRAPIERRTLAASSWQQFPAGHRPIAERPLATLREAIRLGDSKHFPHVLLGALFTTGPDRQEAIALLIDQVRFANEALAMVATAALREITEADIPIGDREAWLRWATRR